MSESATSEIELFRLDSLRVECGTRMVTIEIGQAYYVLGPSELQQFRDALVKAQAKLQKNVDKHTTR